MRISKRRVRSGGFGNCHLLRARGAWALNYAVIEAEDHQLYPGSDSSLRVNETQVILNDLFAANTNPLGDLMIRQSSCYQRNNLPLPLSQLSQKLLPALCHNSHLNATGAFAPATRSGFQLLSPGLHRQAQVTQDLYFGIRC